MNKADACTDRKIIEKIRLLHPKIVVISALERTGFEELAQAMMQEIAALRQLVKLKIPQSEYGLVAIIRREGNVLHEEYEGNSVVIRAEVPLNLSHLFDAYRDESEL